MPHFKIPDTGKQIFVAAFLARVRETGLHEAVARAVATVDPTVLRNDLQAFAPSTGLAALQGTGVRDEEVFVVPSVLRAAPGVLAYYRRLLGVSQKEFYTPASGLNVFKPMEERSIITDRASALIDPLASEMNLAIEKLVHALPSGELRINVDQLPFLTLGAQADGSWRTKIGGTATKEVFEALKEIVRGRHHRYQETASSITVMNNSSREVTLMLAPDPDVVIREDFGRSFEYKAAIEIKGGTDYSNIHNRAGEAEKSHQKAMQDGAGTCWTDMDLARADIAKLKSESPSAKEWIDLAQVQARAGVTWDRLVQRTLAAMGI